MVTLDVICSTAFGVEVNSCKNPDMEILKQSKDFVNNFATGNLKLMLLGKERSLLKFFKHHMCKNEMANLTIKSFFHKQISYQIGGGSVSLNETFVMTNFRKSFMHLIVLMPANGRLYVCPYSHLNTPPEQPYF